MSASTDHSAAAPRVVLVGPPGAGKSTVGHALGEVLRCGVVDSDTLLERDNSMSCGELFTLLGEPEFRRREEVYVAQALMSDGVVSLGGGAVLSAATRRLLAEHTVVYLRVSAEEGTRRTAHLATRPVLAAADGADPSERYREILTQREELYREVATHIVDADGRTPRHTVAEVLALIGVHGDHDADATGDAGDAGDIHDPGQEARL